MLFHSWIFLLFFLLFYPVFLLTRNTRFKDPWLLLSSYVFYGWWNPLYLALIAWSTTVDYLMVVLMARARRRVAASSAGARGRTAKGKMVTRKRGPQACPAHHRNQEA